MFIVKTTNDILFLYNLYQAKAAVCVLYELNTVKLTC